MRIDLTIKELIVLTEQLSDAMDLMIGKKGLEIENADIDYLYKHADMLINITSNHLKSVQDEIKDSYKSKEDEILKCMNIMIPSHLRKKNVVLKGAGEHTRELIKIWKDKVNIIGILSNDKAPIKGYKTLEYRQLSELDIDVIVISSYRYRHEMLKEIEANTKEIEIIDLYKYFEYLGIKGVEKEFYKYIDKDC